jgi:imidazolonepropionase-like amidohydrolase
MADLALTGATIYTSPDAEPIRGGTVVIRGDRIASVGRSEVPAGSRIIDCRGLTVTAGFWNSHVHFFERKWAGAASIPAEELEAQAAHFAEFGFTSVFDLGSDWENTRAIRDSLRSPRIFSTGPGLIPVGGHPPDIVYTLMGVMKVPMPEIATAADATTAAKRQLDEGVDGIKLFGSTPAGTALPEGAFEAAVAEAHRMGKPVFVHPNNAEDVMAACRGGVDVIAHTTPRSGAWSDEVIEAMRQGGVALAPTLTLWKFFSRHDRLSAQKKIIDTAVDQLRAWHHSGGDILFGTDLGAVDPDPTDEYELMAAAGMRFEDILASLTTVPARRFGMVHRTGRIVEGFDADIAVFEGSFANVRITIKAGDIQPAR